MKELSDKSFFFIASHLNFFLIASAMDAMAMTVVIKMDPTFSKGSQMPNVTKSSKIKKRIKTIILCKNIYKSQNMHIVLTNHEQSLTRSFTCGAFAYLQT